MWKAIQRELLKAQDLETVVLKGHLIVEIQLNASLEAILKSNIDSVRLSFAKKLELLSCVWPPLKDDSLFVGRSIYESWKELNSIRNKIAHQLSPVNMRALLIAWVTNTLGYKLKTINRTTVLKRNIVKAIALEVGYLSGQVEVYRFLDAERRKGRDSHT